MIPIIFPLCMAISLKCCKLSGPGGSNNGHIYHMCVCVTRSNENGHIVHQSNWTLDNVQWTSIERDDPDNVPSIVLQSVPMCVANYLELPIRSNMWRDQIGHWSDPGWRYDRAHHNAMQCNAESVKRYCTNLYKWILHRTIRSQLWYDQ